MLNKPNGDVMCGAMVRLREKDRGIKRCWLWIAATSQWCNLTELLHVVSYFFRFLSKVMFLVTLTWCHVWGSFRSQTPSVQDGKCTIEAQNKDPPVCEFHLAGGFKHVFIFTPTRGDDPIWINLTILFFKWVETWLNPETSHDFTDFLKPPFFAFTRKRSLQSQSGLTSQFKSAQDEIAKASRTGFGHPTQYGMVTSAGKVSNMVLFKDLVCMGVCLLILLPLSSH